MKTASPSLLLVLLMTAALGSRAAPAADFEPLFDTQTFTGWEGNLDVFRIEDGAVVAGSLDKAIPNNEFLCTKREFDNFELRLKAKLTGPGDNAGIQFRSQRIPNHHEVIGYQCDMGSAFGGSVWGALYDESRRRRILAQGEQEPLKKVFKPNDWNEFVIRCEGPHIQIWLNGYQTVDYTEKEDVATSGVIGLQIHGGKPSEARYQEIQIKILND